MAKEGYTVVPLDVLKERAQKGPWLREEVGKLSRMALRDRLETVTGPVWYELVHREEEIKAQDKRKLTLFANLIKETNFSNANYWLQGDTKNAYGVIIPVPTEEDLGIPSEQYLVALKYKGREEIMVVEPDARLKQQGKGLDFFRPIEPKHRTVSEEPIDAFHIRFSSLGMRVALSGQNPLHADALDHAIERSLGALKYGKYLLSEKLLTRDQLSGVRKEGRVLEHEADIYLRKNENFYSAVEGVEISDSSHDQ